MQEYPQNYLYYPHCMYAPQTLDVKGERYLLYLARFNSLDMLYHYLKSKPALNREVFYNIASENNGYDFAGKPFSEALEDLIGPVDPGYREFLSLQKNLSKDKVHNLHAYETVKSLQGGFLIVPSYIRGEPLCYEDRRRVKKPKFVQIHAGLSYNHMTSKSQVLHRAIILTNVVSALEKSGYKVGINAFELSEVGNELIEIVVGIKRQTSSLNLEALYKTSCRVEFCRRILFRVLETMDVQKASWGESYGCTCSEKFIRSALHLNKNDLFFDQPDRMGIMGSDLITDFKSAINYLNLEDKIDVKKAETQFKDNYKQLIKE